jgi:hypothetical protein
MIIEPELGHNETSTGCQVKNFTVTPPFYWVLLLFLLGLLLFYSAHSLLFAALDKGKKIRKNQQKGTTN